MALDAPEAADRELSLRGGATDVHPADADRPPPLTRATSVARACGFGGLALAWYAVTTFGTLDLPNFFTAVWVLGVLVALTVEPDARFPHRGITATRRNLVLALLAVIGFAPVAFGMNLLLGRVPIDAGHTLLATLAAACVALPRPAWYCRAWPGPGSSPPRRCSDTAS